MKTSTAKTELGVRNGGYPFLIQAWDAGCDAYWAVQDYPQHFGHLDGDTAQEAVPYFLDPPFPLYSDELVTANFILGWYEAKMEYEAKTEGREPRQPALTNPEILE